MSAPLVKGWCPGAHRPMLSGDGLVVRVRPFRAELSAAQALALCDLARTHGNGTLELTSRANLQIRGVPEAAFPALLEGLEALGLIDADPAVEARRNILMPAGWRAGDLTDRLHAALLQTLPALPPLPAKMGFALDTGPQGQLAPGSADFRFELDPAGALLLRADGAATGRAVPEAGAMAALAELARWFVATGGPEAGRMARHLRQVSLPQTWRGTAPRAAGACPEPGSMEGDRLLGVPFGSMEASVLAELVETSGARAVRLMTGRLLCLRCGQADTPAPAQSKDKMKIEAKPTQKKEKSGLSFTEKHRLEALPSVIERLEGEIAKLETYLAAPDLYAKEPLKFQKATEALVERQSALSAAEEEWLILEEKAGG